MAGEVVLDTAVVELVADTEGLRRDLQRAAKEVQKVGREMQAIGRELTASVTLPIAGIGVAAFKAAADFETALTGIAKTVDAPASAIAALGQSFRELSEEIPVSTNELAKLAELGGQLGIEVANLEGFVETMAALGVSTNLSAEEAGTALARLANIMGTSQTDFDRLGSTIVDLGNNLATTEAEIVAFAQRMAGAGQIAGLTESDVLAIGGALSSVGVEAEAGGTAVQKVLIDINTAVAEGNESLELFARTAGMSAQEFEQAWRQDAGSAFVSFVEGLGSAGDNAVTVLSELGLENQRLIRSFLSLANAGPLLADALGLANDAWRENTALTEEAARFYDRMAARLTQLRNQAVNVAAEFGQALAPGFEAAMHAARGLLDFVRDLVEAFAALPKWVRAASVAAAGLAAALGPAAVAFGAIAQTMGTLLGLRVAASIAGWAAAFAQMAVQVTSVASGLALIQATMGPLARTMATLLGLGLARSLVGWADALAGLVIEVRSGRDAMALFSAVAAPLTRIPMVAAITGWASAFASLAVQVRSVSGAFALLQAAIGPVGWVIAGLAALGAGLTVVVREFRRLQREAREAEEAMDQAAAAVANFNEESTRFALGQWGQALVEARAEVKRLEADMEQAIATAAMFDEPVSSGLQQELLEARQNVQALEALIGSAAKRWTQGFGPAVDESVRSVQELADEFQRIGIGGFDASELSGLVQLQSELRRIVQDTTAAEEDRIRATQVLQQVTAEINRLQGQTRRNVQEEIDLLLRAVGVGHQREESLKRLVQIHDDLRAAYEDGIGSQEDQIERLERMAEIAATIADEIERAARGTDAFQALDVSGRGSRVEQDRGIQAPDIVGGATRLEELRAILMDLDPAALTAAERAQALEDKYRAQAQAATSLVSGLASVLDAFGLLDGEARSAVRGIADLIQGIQGIRAAQAAQAAGEAGAGLALTGGLLGVAGGLAGLLTGLAGGGDEDRRRERAEQERVAQEANRAADALARMALQLENITRWEQLWRDAFSGLDDLVESTLGIDLDLNDWEDEIRAMVDDGASAIEILQHVWGDALRELDPAVFNDLVAGFDDFVKAAKRAEAAFEREQKSIGENLEIRRLSALGLDEEAQALKDRIELQEAEAAGWTKANIAALEHVQALEAEERAAREAARMLDLMNSFLGTFGQELSGIFEGGLLPAGATGAFQDFIESIFAAGNFDAFGFDDLGPFSRIPDMPDLEDLGEFDPFRIVQRFLGGLQIDEALKPFEELVEAGKLTQEEFDALAEFMRTNLNEAIEDTIDGFKEAERAAREAAAAERFRAAQDLRSLQAQLLEVQGRTAEARALRNQIELLAAIEDGRSAEYIATLRQLQAAREHARRVEEQRKAQDDLNRSIAQTTTALNAPAGLRLSLHRWRAMLADGVDVGEQATQQPRFTRQASQDTQEVQEAASVTRQVSADLQLVEPEALMVQPVLELVPPEPLMVAPQIEAVAPEVFVEAAASVQPSMDVGELGTQEIQPDVDVGEVSATLQPLIELLQSDPITFEPDIRLIQPDPLLVEPELILGSGLSVGDMGGGQAAAQSATTIGDTHIDESFTAHIDQLVIESAGPGESGEDLLRKIETAVVRVIRKGGADPLRRRRP